MLKYLIYIGFIIPLYHLHWGFSQVSLFLLSFVFILEIGCFFNIESIGFGLGIDFLSYILIILSIWIISLILVGRKTLIEFFFYEKFFLLLLLLLFILILRFSSINLFIFYLFFESSLIPTFLMILGWGYQGERAQAGIYLLFYTLISSLPLLIIIFYLFNNGGSLSIILVSIYTENISINIWIFFCLYIAFLVKLPIFLVHLWLPRAHVEAPVAGSIILAGVLLKLGGYGILRISLFFWKQIINFVILIIILRLFGGVIISLNCLRQTDIKILVAYSSVSHIGIIIRGLLTFRIWGMTRSLSIILSHGLCSSGLFFLVNVAYERFGSRNLLVVKGLLNYLPKIRLWWFLFCAINIAAPPSLNLLREIGLINSLIRYRTLNFLVLIMIGFLAAGYSLYLFSFSQHGKIVNGIFGFYPSRVRENLILFLHWIPLNALVLNREIFIIWLYLNSLIKKNLNLWGLRWVSL